jgi:hypothetical protein
LYLWNHLADAEPVRSLRLSYLLVPEPEPVVPVPPVVPLVPVPAAPPLPAAVLPAVPPPDEAPVSALRLQPPRTSTSAVAASITRALLVEIFIFDPFVRS